MNFGRTNHPMLIELLLFRTRLNAQSTLNYVLVNISMYTRLKFTIIAYYNHKNDKSKQDYMSLSEAYTVLTT